MAQNDQDIRMIERDLEETRARTESTIHALQNKLQPRAMLDEATRFFQGTDSGEYAERFTRNGLAQAKENPIPMVLIGAGVALLASKRPGRPRYVSTGSSAYGGQYEGQSSFENDYLSSADYDRQDEELSSLYDTEYEETHRVIGAAETIDTTYTRLDDEDDDAYQNRLYEARGKAFKIDRSKDDDDHAFRRKVDERLKAAKSKRDEYTRKAGDFRRRQQQRASNLRDQASQRATQLRDQAGQRAAQLGQDGRQAARQGVRRGGELYEENPLVAALMAVAAGAVTGAMFDVTDKERQALGGVADDINQGVRNLNEAANEKVQEFAHRVEDAAESADDKIDEVEKDLGSKSSKSGTTTGGTTSVS